MSHRVAALAVSKRSSRNQIRASSSANCHGWNTPGKMVWTSLKMEPAYFFRSGSKPASLKRSWFRSWGRSPRLHPRRTVMSHSSDSLVRSRRSPDSSHFSTSPNCQGLYLPGTARSTRVNRLSFAHSKAGSRPSSEMKSRSNAPGIFSGSFTRSPRTLNAFAVITAANRAADLSSWKMKKGSWACLSETVRRSSVIWSSLISSGR